MRRRVTKRHAAMLAGLVLLLAMAACGDIEVGPPADSCDACYLSHGHP